MKMLRVWYICSLNFYKYISLPLAKGWYPHKGLLTFCYLTNQPLFQVDQFFNSYHLQLGRGKVKVKWSRYRLGVAQRVGRGIAVLFHDRGTRRGWVVSSTTRSHFAPGKTRYPFCRRLGGPQGRSWRAENLVRTGIQSRTAQPVVSSYTDWATRPTIRKGLVRQNMSSSA